MERTSISKQFVAIDPAGATHPAFIRELATVRRPLKEAYELTRDESSFARYFHPSCITTEDSRHLLSLTVPTLAHYTATQHFTDTQDLIAELLDEHVPLAELKAASLVCANWHTLASWENHAGRALVGMFLDVPQEERDVLVLPQGITWGSAIREVYTVLRARRFAASKTKEAQVFWDWACRHRPDALTSLQVNDALWRRERAIGVGGAIASGAAAVGLGFGALALIGAAIQAGEGSKAVANGLFSASLLRKIPDVLEALGESVDSVTAAQQKLNRLRAVPLARLRL